MSKNKKQSDKLTTAAKQCGFLLMAAAATLGMMELPDHIDKRVIAVNQPAFAFVRNTDDQGQGNQLRRERDETVAHYMSYSVAQRTPSRSGKAGGQ